MVGGSPMRRGCKKRSRAATILLAFALVAFGYQARAETIHIVALGASNTAGRGASSPWPSQLQSMLRAKGYDVSVSNQGVPGDTTAGMLGRLDSAVPDGTRLVILNPANINDSKHGIRAQQASYVSQIRSRLAARNIKVIVLPGLASIAGNNRSGVEHFNDEGHARIAAYLLPRVIGAIGRPRR